MTHCSYLSFSKSFLHSTARLQGYIESAHILEGEMTNIISWLASAHVPGCDIM